MYNWNEDGKKILKPSHWRKADNFARNLDKYLGEQPLTHYEVHDQLADRISTLDERLRTLNPVKSLKLFFESLKLDRYSSAVTIISLLAESNYYHTLLLVMESSDELAYRFGCHNILNPENRVLGYSSDSVGDGYYQFRSEYLFKDK